MKIGNRKIWNSDYIQEQLDKLGFETMLDYLTDRVINKKWPYAKTAREIGVSAPTISNYSKAGGLCSAHKQGGANQVRWDIHNKDIYALKDSGMCAKKIAEKLGCSRGLVHHALTGNRLKGVE